MEREKKVTARDVAKLAGVSPATVSMILNNYDAARFPESTRTRVLEACNTLGYRKTAGMVYSTENQKLLIAICPSYANMHYVRLISAMQDRARELGYSLLAFSTSRDIGEETRILQMCAQLPFAGILFLYRPENDMLLQQLSWKKPMVHVYDRNTSLDVDLLELDSYKTGDLIASHLLSLGHRNIAYISTNLESKQIARIRRVEGMRQAFRSHNLDPDGCIRVCTPATEALPVSKPLTEYETGYLIARKLVSRGEPVSAIVGMNDMAAFGIMDAILELGKRVPQDYSVCGCDNVATSRYKRISLTTVEHYSQQRGREAVDILVKKIEGESVYGDDSPVSVTRVEYAPKLIARGSTARHR
jgi:LacI family transcriptional regulator